MEVSSPWVDEVPAATEFASVVLPGAEHVVSYHIIRRGGCWAPSARRLLRGRQALMLGITSSQSEHLLGPGVAAAQRLNEGKTTEDKAAAVVERTLPKRNA
jgi:hypothetical protein